MTALKQTLHEEGYEEATEAFVYTAVVTHLDSDMAFLGEHLVDQITAWRAEHRVAHPSADKRSASPHAARPSSPATDPLAIPYPLLKVHPE